MDRAQPEPRWSVGLLRAITYFLALLVVSLGILLASVATTLPFATRVTVAVLGVVIATTLVLLVHGSLGWPTYASVVFLSLAFILPGLLIRSTPTPCSGHLVSPCDPGFNSHLGLRVGFAALLVGVALAIAVVGSVRASGAD